MTTLKETLSILSEAVPALETKVEVVARQGDAFTRAGRDVLVQLSARSSAAEEMVARLRAVFTGVREHAQAEQERLQTLTQALHEAVVRETEACAQGTLDLDAAGDRVGGALGTLATQLTQAGERATAAAEKARTALAGLGEGVLDGQGELQAAVEESTTAMQSAQQAIAEARPLADEGLTALRESMASLVVAVEERLSQIQQRLGELSAEQETAAGEALAALEAGREECEQQVAERLDGELHQSLEPELQAVDGAFGELAQQVEALQAETATRRETLVGQLGNVAERIPPLQLATQQVQQAAEKVGLAWP
jgi:hypothetical protein